MQRYKNAKHAAFGEYVVKSFDIYPEVEESFPEYTALVTSAYEKEDELFQRFERPFLTADMKRDNAARIDAFFLIRDSCRAAKRSTNPQVKSAGEKILKISDKYGGYNISTYSLGERTGLLTNFIADLQKKLQTEVETLNLQNAVSQLAESNNNYWQADLNRLQDDALYADQKLIDARNASDQAIRLLFNIVNNKAKMGEYSKFRLFINYINAANSQLSFGMGNKSSSTTKPVVPDEGTDDEKKHRYADFMNGEELVSRIQCLVGRAIPKSKIPAPPEGMKWEGIPTKMPDEDIVITAVPEDEEETQPEEFTPEELREFPVLPALYGSVEEITNPNSLISPFNPLSQNYKLSNLLPGTPAPTDGPVPEGKSKVKFDREEEEAEARRIRREVRRLLHSEGSEFSEDSETSEGSETSENSEDSALLDTKPFYVWYDTGLPIQAQGYLPPLLEGFHWYDIEHVLETDHYTVRAVRNTSPEEGEQEDEDLTAGMLWPADRPAPDGWCVVTFRPAHGEPITKLYRQGATIVSQGFLPENEEGYIWSGIYSKLTGSTHTAEEVEE